ncbi:AAA family ATPase [Polaribacter sp.]|uniref:AAA family ATPase n=1 Tax=Polaribacter sp. TaxID=1920175 RepID=UPI003F6CF9CF
MKIKSIEVVNYKAIQNQEIDLNGHSAIITGGNNKGKSSLLKGLINRFQGEKPNIIVRRGETKGSNKMELTDGSKIHWGFTEKSEKLSFTTAEDIKMTTGVISAIGEKYFGVKFDIDKFIRSTKKEALKMVQNLLGIDLSEIDKKYAEKYSERTDANRELKRISGLNKKKPEEVTNPDIDAIKKRKEDLVKENTSLKENWVKENEEYQKEAIEFNELQENLKNDLITIKNDFNKLLSIRGTAVSKFIDYDGITNELIKKHPEPKPYKEVKTLDEPTYHTFTEIDKELEDAYTQKYKFDNYERELKEYNDWVEEGKKAREKSDNLTKELNTISEERLQMIKDANLPEEFEMTDDGLLYNGLPIDNNQLSSSSKYICALKLGSLGLGKVRAMHFDCSFLDKNSLNEIMEWAESEDLQLLIEKPDFNAGEIQYNILNKLD